MRTTVKMTSATRAHSLLLLVASTAAWGVAQDAGQFPADFLFGVATASYQIEGAWNEGGKGENIFDHMFHTTPNLTTDGTNGDVACDSYHKYETDIELAKNMSVDVYRLSIAWARILPTGDINNINQEGIDYYNNVIDGLLANDIEPVITMFHWDLPQKLQDIGGWPNPRLADYFVEYARVLYENYGDRVKWWQTFNEPASFVAGYSGNTAIAPAINSSGVGDYMAAYTLLKAHAAAYRLYDEQYRATQQGKVGITINVMWYEPATDAQADVDAAERKNQFYAGLYGHPIFTSEGDYPAVVKQRVAENSQAEGYPRSRLIEFTPEEVEYIKGTADFFGLNHYTSYPTTEGVSGSNPSMDLDAGAVAGDYTDYPLAASSWLRVMSACDYFLPGAPKSKLYPNNPHSLQDLQQDISDETAAMPAVQRPSAFGNFLTSSQERQVVTFISYSQSVPWGFRKTLNWLVQQYPGYPIFVMENGWSDTGELDDQGRIDYYGAYLAEMLNAMNEDGVPVIGYTAWSLLDNFEWGTGFTTRFGLHYVDITDPDRKRTPKASSRFLEEIFRTKTLPAKYMR